MSARRSLSAGTTASRRRSFWGSRRSRFTSRTPDGSGSFCFPGQMWTAYDLIGVYHGGKLYNIDSQAPNAVTFEWLRTRGFDKIRPETVCGSSRIDFWMRRGDVTYLLEVKGCTLEEGGVGYFPDAPTERGIRHLNTLSRAAEEGIRAGIAFVICMKGVDRVLPNDRTQPSFGQALLRAKQAGVTVWFLKTDPKPDALFVTGAERDNS